jgi:hypothetical protein
MAEKLKRLRAPQKLRRRNLFIGLTLVVTSVGGVWAAINLNNHTSQYLVAASDFASGTELLTGATRDVELNLGDSAALYLKPGDLPPGSYLLFSAAKGQLIPRSSIATRIIDAREPVVITSIMPLPTGLKPGDAVDIWTSALTDKNLFAPPVALVLDAEVTAVRQPSGMFANAQPEVQVLVPAESVPPILDAIASKDAVSLVLKRNLGND